MRQTQIDGETYVNCNDLAKWMLLGNGILAKAAPDAVEAVKALAETIVAWGNDPKRSKP